MSIYVVNAQADAPTGGPRFQTVGSQGRNTAHKAPYAGDQHRPPHILIIVPLGIKKR